MSVLEPKMTTKTVLDIIKSRRSIRDFLDTPVPPDVVSELLEAARWAPSGSNVQPWLMVVIRKQSVIRKIDMFAPGLQGGPPLVFVLCSEETDEKDSTAVMDIAMAAQNVLLTATDHGLGSCAIRGFNQKALTILLQLPEHLTPELIISVGYTAKPVTIPSRRAIEDLVCWEKYGGCENGQDPG